MFGGFLREEGEDDEGRDLNEAKKSEC